MCVGEDRVREPPYILPQKGVHKKKSKKKNKDLEIFLSFFLYVQKLQKLSQGKSLLHSWIQR